MSKIKTTEAFCGIVVILWMIFPSQVTNILVKFSNIFGKYVSDSILKALGM